MDLREAGEFALIAAIRRLLERGGAPAAGVRIGPGHDCAVVAPRPGFDLLLKVDEAIEGVHFDLAWIDARGAGRRAMTQSVSDIAAMAGVPRWATLALALPPSIAAAEALAIVEGAAARAAEFGCAIVGGNLARSPRIAITVGVVGEVEPGQALLRSGARPGDALYVTGDPGVARAGLFALEAGRGAEAALGPAVRRWRDPPARVEEARFLRDRAQARAMIDLSDGLAGDLGHLARESRVGARIDRAALPVGAALRAAADALGRDPVSLVLEGGEDFELLFAAPGDAVEAAREEFEARFGVPLARIGEIVEGSEVAIAAPGEPPRPLRVRSYEHFSMTE